MKYFASMIFIILVGCAVKHSVTEIKNKEGEIIYASQKETLREAVIEAVSRGIDLEGAALKGIDLSGANLRGARLRGADLSDSMLMNADMRGGDFSHSDLRGSNLFGAIIGTKPNGSSDRFGSKSI